MLGYSGTFYSKNSAVSQNCKVQSSICLINILACILQKLSTCNSTCNMEKENGTAAAADGSAEALKVALKWVLLHSTTSNVELARLSNVCRHWRRIVTAVILEQATWKAIPSSPLLLLPSMTTELIRTSSSSRRKQKEETAQKEETEQKSSEKCTSNQTIQNSEPFQKQKQKIQSQNQHETYCAAWFASEGIQLLDLDDEEDGFQDEVPDPFAPGGSVAYPAGSSDEDGTRKYGSKKLGDGKHNKHSTNSIGGNRKANQRAKSPMMMNIQHRAPRLEQMPSGPHSWARGHGPNTKMSFSDQGIIVSHEWRGYRQAIEVLQPFGYSQSFVEDVIRKAKTYANKGSEEDVEIDSDSQRTLIETADKDVTKTTMAVRGTTIARPEGYCLCWEPPAQLPPMEWSRACTHDEEVLQSIRWQERQRKLKQWKEWRRDLQLTVLPQVLARTNAPPDASNAVVQFLNSDEKNAVRLMTPKFSCGPICEPVTIIVVGIATEDGCFCSGLHHRFELGHLYPDSAIAELAEMSPICMATDPWECLDSPKASADDTDSAEELSPLEQHLAHDSDDDSDDDAYSDDSSSDFEQMDGSNRSAGPKTNKYGWLNNCTCIFRDKSNPRCYDAKESAGSVKRKSKDDDEVSETAREEDDEGHDEDDDDVDDGSTAQDAERILRGKRIPGVWHCYTAVFDGMNSTLRVDGVQEVLSAADENQRNKCDFNNQELQSSSSKSPTASDDPQGSSGTRESRRRGRRAMLDGLTIGSDHCFDMTLCFGQGSGGEGEGAIAEIAVFAGRLDTEDLDVLEKRLMRKHAIPVPSMNREDLVKEDEYTRNAHSLYCQLPPEAAQALRHKQGSSPLTFEQNSIPLRVMAKHRSVAWHQYNAVTGEELRIKRIGSRSGGSSSDW